MALARAFAGVKKGQKVDTGGLRVRKARGQRKRYSWAPVSSSILTCTTYVPSFPMHSGNFSPAQSVRSCHQSPQE